MLKKSASVPGMAGVALILSALSHWKLIETDFFWQSRAGEEILSGKAVQVIDTWSTTAYGHPWYNFQWLSSVCFYWFSKAGAEAMFAPTCRAALIFVLLLLVGQAVRKITDSTRITVLGISLFYLVACGRLQLRPDLFGILFFSALLLGADSEGGFKRDLGVLVLWSNFHAGTVPVGICFVLLRILFDQEYLRSRALSAKPVAILATASSWLATPIHYHAIETTFRIASSYDWSIIGNADHWPFTPQLLNFTRYGLAYDAWALVLSSSFLFAWKGEGHFARAYRDRRFRMLGLAFFTLLTFARVRARPYSLLFALPVFLPVLSGRVTVLKPEYRPEYRNALLIQCALLAAIGIALQLMHAPKLGFGVNEGEFPVGTTRYLLEKKPSGKLLNHYDFGGYLIDRARDYPVAQDGRETIYEDFFKEKQEATQDPKRFARFLREHGFDILMPRSPIDSETLLRWYPPDEWQLVASDQASLLFIRKKH